MVRKILVLLYLIVQLNLVLASIESFGPEMVGNYNVSFNFDNRLISLLGVVETTDANDKFITFLDPDYFSTGFIFLDYNNSTNVNTRDSMKKVIIQSLNKSEKQITIKNREINNSPGLLGIDESDGSIIYVAVYEIAKPSQQIPGSTLCQIYLLGNSTTLIQEATDTILESIQIKWIQPAKQVASNISDK